MTIPKLEGHTVNKSELTGIIYIAVDFKLWKLQTEHMHYLVEQNIYRAEGKKRNINISMMHALQLDIVDLL